ncbi:hypothetical protein HZ326_19094 [Fusarium oxysporum f. sp. albedinis]|nr:hypothetical protein HZ326_19094 [Fusarium oxysporum f. sp. albedinis]
MGAQLGAFITTILFAKPGFKMVLQATICKLTASNPQIMVHFGPHVLVVVAWLIISLRGEWARILLEFGMRIWSKA